MLSPKVLLAVTLMAGQCLATAIPPPPLADDPHTSAAEGPNLVKRQKTKPDWITVKRKGMWHLQQLAAGKKIEASEGDREEDVDMLNGAGAGVDIYILDSGIRLSHVAFSDGRASNFKDTAVTTYLSRDAPWDDVQGHGTHVAGLAGGAKHGVAQWANLINVKIEHCEYEKTTTDTGERVDKLVCRSTTQGILDAIKDVTAKHNEKKANPPQGWKGSVINMSLGLGKLYHNGVGRAIENAFNAGIPIAVAAGNRERGATWQANGTLCESTYTICVGATTRKYAKVDIGKDGPNVDIWAPGNGLLSAGISGDQATIYKTGTSMATPLVAGIMALIVGYEGPLNDQKGPKFVYDRLLENALTGVMPSLFPDEKNVFAQTGINLEKHNQDYQMQPYDGVDSSYTILQDPYGSGIWRKRGSPEGAEDEGYKTTTVENGDPNDLRPLLFVQEKLKNEQDPDAGDDDYMPTIPDDGSDEGGNGSGGGGNAPKKLCEGNQIYQDCEGGKLPNVPDNSGPQQPVCMKADGSPGSPARLNQQKLREAASGYCKELVDQKWLLKEGGSTPRAPVLEGQAQNGKSMSLAALFHKGSCPHDKSELNMGDLGLDKCVENFSTVLSSFCGIDSTWGDKYVKDFEVLGGLFASDCVLYSAFGGAL